MAKKKELEALGKKVSVDDDPIARLAEELSPKKKKKVIKKKKVVKDDQDDLAKQSQIDQDDQDDQDPVDQDQNDQDDQNDDSGRQPADYCDDCGGCDGCDGCEGCDGYSGLDDYYTDDYSVQPDTDDDDKAPAPTPAPAPAPAPTVKKARVAMLPSIDDTRKNGPGKAYKFWDYSNRMWIVVRDFWAAKQASDKWDVIYVWYEDGKISRPLTTDEIIRYLP